MANIDTPGYRAIGMDFEAEMREAMAEIAADATFEAGAPEADAFGSPTLNAKPAASHRKARSQPKIHAVDGLVVRPDGNNVSMDRESMNLAAAQLRFKLGVALLKGEFAGIMSAIHADAK